MGEAWEGWCCVNCKKTVAEGEVQLSYLEFKRAMKGPRCPDCGAVFVSEEMARKLRNVEEQIEDK